MDYKTYEIKKFDNGSEEWFLNGDLHREDGPAVECSDGVKEWYLDGKKLTEQKFKQENK